MSKYIDADKLKSALKKLFESGRYCNPDDIISIITSLQQEQSEVDLDDDFVFDEIMSVYDSNDCLPPRDGESLEMLEKVFRHAFNLGRNANR